MGRKANHPLALFVGIAQNIGIVEAHLLQDLLSGHPRKPDQFQKRDAYVFECSLSNPDEISFCFFRKGSAKVLQSHVFAVANPLKGY